MSRRVKAKQVVGRLAEREERESRRQSVIEVEYIRNEVKGLAE